MRSFSRLAKYQRAANPPRPRPDLWYPLAQLPAALRLLLRTAVPDAFAAIARDARAQFAVLSALVRRYIHILAAEIILPPLREVVPDTDKPAQASASQRSRRAPCFGTLLVQGLRDLPVPWHITRRLAPGVDALLCAMDQAARPQAWAGLNSS